MKRVILYAVLTLLFFTGAYHSFRLAPDGISYVGPLREVDTHDVVFLADRTHMTKDGERVVEQEIFDELFIMIDEAEQYILVDFFLFNDFTGVETESYRQLSGELTDALIAKKRENPSIAIDVITDPINTFYGGMRSEQLESLRGAGIQVIITDLKQLRDSNPVFSAPWRVFVQWFGSNDEGGWLPNPLDPNGQEVTVRSYLKSLNFKANHRKVALADYVDEAGETRMSVLITSANPHDGSSAHGNTAVRIYGDLWQDVYKSEAVVATFSGAELAPVPEGVPYVRSTSTQKVGVKLLTEYKIKAQLLAEIALLQQGDELDMAMFYIADRDIVQALRAADDRGVKLRLLFDASKDAFGREKNGQPNRQVAYELMKHTDGNTEVRWCNTHGEQCHSKLTLFRRADERMIILGSANLTHRNLDNLNLETNVLMYGATGTPLFAEVEDYFDGQWNNIGGEYSVPYEVYADDSLWKRISYRFKEKTGLSRW